MTTAEKLSPSAIEHVKMNPRREMQRRLELEAIRRSTLALIEKRRRFEEEYREQMLALSQRMLDVLNDQV